jgi:phosphopantothenoylcysteine synthetase/decarboxylase
MNIESKLKSLAGKRVLITSGPTWVSIDPMRIISNRATGELGQRIARTLNQAGAHVTVLEGPVTHPLKEEKIQVKKFCFYEELAALLKTELKRKFDAIIHNAAVSDYQLKQPFNSKLNSNQKNLTLKLVLTEKLINSLKTLAPKTFLVGFKLEDFQNKNEIIAESKKLIANSHCDLVIANTLKGGYKAYLLNHQAQIQNTSNSRAQLTKNLVLALSKNLCADFSILSRKKSAR